MPNREDSMKENKDNRKKYWYLIGALAVLVLIVFIWKGIEVRNIQKKMAEERIVLNEHYRKVIINKNEEMLRLVTIPFVWAVRKEMLRENYEQINEYFVQFIKEQDVKQILIAKPDGLIVVSTDKKLEGMSFASLYPPDLLEQDTVFVKVNEDETVWVAAPILGLNAKLGVLFMIYKPKPLDSVPPIE